MISGGLAGGGSDRETGLFPDISDCQRASLKTLLYYHAAVFTFTAGVIICGSATAATLGISAVPCIGATVLAVGSSVRGFILSFGEAISKCG